MRKYWKKTKNELFHWEYTPNDLTLDKANEFHALALKELCSFSFVKINQIHIVTEKTGDDAFVQDCSIKSYIENTINFVANNPDVVEIQLSLDLSCLDYDFKANSTKKITIEKGISIVVDSDENLRLLIDLHTDIFSVYNKGQNEYHNKIAQKNAPRLASFLRELEEKLSLSLEYWSSEPKNHYLLFG